MNTRLRSSIPAAYRPRRESRTTILAATTLALSLSVTLPATELLVNSFWTPSHLMRQEVFDRWAADVERVTEGRVTSRFPTSTLAPPSRQWHMVTSGIADVAIVFNGFERNRLHLPTIADLPFGTPSAESASVALWRTYKRYFETVNEYSGVKLLGLMTHSGGDLYSLTTPIRNVADLAGMKIRTTDGSSSDAMQALGAVAVPSSGIGAYQLVSRGIVDGLIMPTGDMRTFNMLQHANFAVAIPGKIYNGSFSLFMNIDTWNTISKTDQKAILEVSEETFARRARAWDDSDEKAIEEMTQRNINRTQATKNFVEELEANLTFVSDAWITEANRRGVDGQAALAFFRAEAKRIAAGTSTES